MVTIGRRCGEIPVKLNQRRPVRTLPDPFYYLNNFQTVLSSIEERYAQLLVPDELQFMARFRALPAHHAHCWSEWSHAAARCSAAADCTTRKSATCPRRQRRCVQSGCVDEAPDLNVEQLQTLLTKAELIDNFPILRPYRALKKAGTRRGAARPDRRPATVSGMVQTNERSGLPLAHRAAVRAVSADVFRQFSPGLE